MSAWLRSRSAARFLLSAGAGGSAIAALLGFAAVMLWQPSTGVILLPVERARVAAGAGLLSGALFLALPRAGVPRAVAAVLPAAGLEAFRWVDVVGAAVARADRVQAVAVVVILALVAAGARKAPRVSALFLALGAVGSAWMQGNRVRRPVLDRPPVVLITLDTVRADHIKGFGGDVQTANTPALDRFFATARVYRHAYATQPITGPSHTSMLSGLDVREHGVNANGVAVPTTIPWVPEELQHAGWRTRAAVSAAVLDSTMRFDRGFDAFDSAFDSRLPRAFPFLNWFGFHPEAGTAMSRWGADTLQVLGAFPRGTFTWVHLYDAHWPYTPSPLAGHFAGLDDVTPLRERSVGRQRTPSGRVWPADLVKRGKDLYRAQLSDLDMVFRRVLERIPDDATVVVAGDHGESLDEHNYVFAHGRLPYSTDVRTVLGVRSPGVSPTWEDAPVSLTVVANTLRAAAGMPTPDGTRGMFDPAPDAPVVSVAYMKGASTLHALGALSGVAVRHAGRASVWTRWDDPGTFEVSADPRELSPVPADADELADLQRHADAAPPAAVAAPEMRDALEALGYTDADGGGGK